MIWEAGKHAAKIQKSNKEIGIHQKKIIGEDNRIELVTGNFRNITFSIYGRENFIHIEDGGCLKNVRFFINGSNNRIFVGKSDNIHRAEFTINGNGCTITLGDNNSFPSGPVAFCVSGDGSGIKIGNRNMFAWGGHNLTAEDGTILSVGSECVFSNDVYVRTGDSHSIFDMTSGRKLNVAKDVHIGNRVWVAPCVRILKGASVKDDSVVGTNSVVTREFSEGNVVIAGTPAKIVREHIYWKP